MNDTVRYSVAVATSLAVGGALGYLITKKVLTAKYEAILDEEVKKVKEYYKERYSEKKEDVADIPVVKESPKTNGLKEKLQINSNLVEELGYVSLPVVDERPTEEVLRREQSEEAEEPEDYPHRPKNYQVEAKYQDVIDYSSPEFKEFVATRDTSKPYVIAVGEFMEDNPEYEKECLVYYIGDDTLCDSRNHPIIDIENTVGIDNLDKFGEFSQDDAIVYVRNDRISSDFEIVYDPREYMEAVAGFLKPQRNKPPKPNLKMREDD